jgi:hypothetical protein
VKEKSFRSPSFEDLRALLKIEPAETNKALLITGLMFIASSGAAIGSPGVEALFFDRVGVENLPYMYVALGILIAASSLAITALMGRVNRVRLYMSLPLGMAASLVGARFLLAFDFNWFYPLLWLGMELFWTLLNLFTWGLAGLSFDTRQAKRLFPLFSAGGIVGLTVGGLMTKPLVGWLNTENLLLVWAITLVAAFGLARAISGQVSSRSVGQARKPAPFFERVIEGFDFVRRSELLRWMAWAAALFAVLYYAVVFPFSKAATAQFPDLNSLTAFLGIFQGASMGAAFLASLLFANRIYARFGLMTAILILPLLYLSGFSVLLVLPAFSVLVIFRFCQLFWSEGVSEGANQALFNLVPLEKREQTRTFVRGVVNPLGVSVVGGMLLASENLPNSVMALIGAAGAVVTVALVWNARKSYVQALMDALRSGGSHLIESDAISFTVFRRDPAALAALTAGLAGADRSTRRVSAEILSEIGATEALDAIVPALEDSDPVVRAALLKAISRSGASSAILEVLNLLHDHEPEVRLEAVMALRRLAGYPAGLAAQ